MQKVRIVMDVERRGAETAWGFRPGRIVLRRVAGLVGTGLTILTIGLPGATEAAPAASLAQAPFRADMVLVGFKTGVSPAGIRTTLTGSSGTHVRTLGDGTHVVRVPHGQVLSAVKSLKANRNVRYAEPDFIQTASATPDDPAFGLQWGYQNTGQTVNGITGTPGDDEHVAPAWDVTTGTRSVVVAEVDSGVQYTHPDLAANIWSNPGGVGGCAAGTHGYNVISATCDPMDDDASYQGHGTHVAGIIGAVGNNGVGITGVNWQTTILPIKWLDASGSGSTSDLITGLDWVVRAKQNGVNVRVVNDSATFVGTAFSQALSDEIDVLGSNNILFVTAAGNTGQNNDDPDVGRYPCRYGRANEICVTASNQSDALPSWANFGVNTVDLAAPGDNIYSTLLTNDYGYISGGSMASPQVAGAAALILSKSDMSVATLKSAILNSVDVLPTLSGMVRTGGRLNICKALPGCNQVPPPDKSPPVVTGERLTRKIFAVGSAPTALSASAKRGTTLRYALSETARVSVAISSSGSGRRKGTRCVKPTPDLRRAKRCTRHTLAGTLRRTGVAGRNALAFSGRIGTRKLSPGAYQMTLVSTDAAGNRSKPTRFAFVIVLR